MRQEERYLKKAKEKEEKAEVARKKTIERLRKKKIELAKKKKIEDAKRKVEEEKKWKIRDEKVQNFKETDRTSATCSSESETVREPPPISALTHALVTRKLLTARAQRELSLSIVIVGLTTHQIMISNDNENL